MPFPQVKNNVYVTMHTYRSVNLTLPRLFHRVFVTVVRPSTTNPIHRTHAAAHRASQRRLAVAHHARAQFVLPGPEARIAIVEPRAFAKHTFQQVSTRPAARHRHNRTQQRVRQTAEKPLLRLRRRLLDLRFLIFLGALDLPFCRLRWFGDAVADSCRSRAE